MRSSIVKLFKTNVFLAPMAGYTDAGFRYLASSFGAGLTVTEMVSAKALVMKNRVTKYLLYKTVAESPCAVQIFGHEADVMGRVACNEILSGFDIIDINMGCPMRKIINNGEGSALLSNPALASSIIRAVKKSGKYVTVKFRTGITDNSIAVDFAKMCEDSGADMITVHGRTQSQLYSGKADWDTIAKVVKAVNIPVIANGDIVDRETYLKCAEQTGAWGYAIGRGALGRPYIFSEILKLDYTFDIGEALDKHISILRDYLPQRVIANEIKKHICYYVKGLPNAKKLIVDVNMQTDTDIMVEMTKEYLKRLFD